MRLTIMPFKTLMLSKQITALTVRYRMRHGPRNIHHEALALRCLGFSLSEALSALCG